MKLLFVYGDPDNGFGALFGEQDFLSVQDNLKSLWREAKNKGLAIIKDNTLFARAYEFNSVDPKFIDFVKDNIADLDKCKEQDFFIVEE